MDISRAHDLAIELMTQHGLRKPEALGTGDYFEFGFNGKRREAGVCRTWDRRTLDGRYVRARGRIELSKPYVECNVESQVRDTILHEIAHAIAGHAAGHGVMWQAQCLLVGARPVACGSTADGVVLPKGKYVAECCGATFYMYARPKRARYCRQCKAQINWRVQ
jgi:predicted SprT family Zn-dependent metalloprotease